VSPSISSVRVVLVLSILVSLSQAAELKRNCGGLPTDTLAIDGAALRLSQVTVGQSTLFLYDTGKAEAPLQYSPVSRISRSCGETASPSGAAPLTSAVSGLAVAGGDFNGDGVPDAVSVAVAPKQLNVYLADSTGALKPGASYTLGTNLEQVVAADVNGDRKLDLLVADSGKQPDDPGGVFVLLGNGDGTFRAPARLNAGEGPVAIAVADFDRDGRPDLAVAAEFSASVNVMLGRGDGTFPFVTEVGVDEGPVAVLAADFNGDGRADLAVANNFSSTVAIILGSGDGTFLPTVSSNTEFDPGFLAAADFNGDGKLDLAVLYESTNTLSIMLGRGDGFFGLPFSYVVGGRPISLALTDFDGDGILDAVTPDPPSHSLLILFGRKEGTFDAPTLYSSGPGPRAVAIADFNSDGKTDLITANEGSNDVTVFLGGGDGAFRALPRAQPLC